MFRISNVAVGAKWGVIIGGALSAVAAIPALIRFAVGPQPEWSHIPSFPVLLLLYICGGLVGGAVVGFLWPLAQWWWGRRLLGALAMMPVMVATGQVVQLASGDAPAWLWALSGAVVGIGLSFVPEDDAKRRWPPRRRYRWGGG